MQPVNWIYQENGNFQRDMWRDLQAYETRKLETNFLPIHGKKYRKASGVIQEISCYEV